MSRLSRIVTVLSLMGAVIRTAHGVSSEEETAYCNVVKNIYSSCSNLCSSSGYRKWGKSYYSSGKGEFCETQDGPIVAIELKNQKLSSLDASIGDLKSLVILDLSNDYLTTIPASLKSLTSLTSLYT